MTTINEFISEFFPEYFEYKSTDIDSEVVTLNFSTKARKVKCPKCSNKTTDYATYYTRSIQDLPILDRSTYVNIKFRKMECNNSSCNVNYFNEPLDDYVQIKKRYSNRLIDLLIKVSLTESAEGGSRILREKNINVSPDKLLQLAKEYEHEIDKSKVISIGVDDFALKKSIDMALFL